MAYINPLPGTKTIIPTPTTMAFKFFAMVVALAVVGDVRSDTHDYTYGYDVQDPFTGDSKSQVETKSGDIVHGSYSLNDPDGTRRTVDYTAHPVHGFNAVVRKTPIVQVATPVVVPTSSSAKVVPAATSPLGYPSQPLTYSSLPLAAAYPSGFDYRYQGYPYGYNPYQYVNPYYYYQYY